MDVNDMRVAVMLLGLVLFLGIWAWTWSSRRRAAFDEAERLPFLDDDAGLDAAGAPGATHGAQR
jgi:cytochrome c oxidase cbb3-type subunit 4